MVLKAWGDLSDARINAPETKEARRMGSNRHCSEVPCPLAQPHGVAKPKSGNSNSILAPNVEPYWNTGEPPAGFEDNKNNYLTKTLCD